MVFVDGLYCDRYHEPEQENAQRHDELPLKLNKLNSVQFLISHDLRRVWVKDYTQSSHKHVCTNTRSTEYYERSPFCQQTAYLDEEQYQSQNKDAEKVLELGE